MRGWGLVLGKTIVNVVGSKPEEGSLPPEMWVTPIDDNDQRWIGDEAFRPITATSLRLCMLKMAGIKPSQVAAAIDAIADDMTREEASIMWEYATEYHREHPLVATLGSAFGLSKDQIDAMWRVAETL